jgi:mannose-6-phosphate isomerase-like protein (cupin superfamily)
MPSSNAVEGATYLEPGEGERYPLGGSSVTLKATSEITAGRFFLSEGVLEPGFQGPPLHVHRELHDMFYVLEGTLTLRLGDEVRQAGPGTFVCVPPGSPHTFSNPSEVPVRILNFNVPGGFEGYMRDLGAAAAEGRPLSPEEIGRIASRYDFERAT